MKFEYIAVNQKGEEIDGILEAESKDEAIMKLRGAGLYPTRVAPEGESDSVKEEDKENKEDEGDKSPTPEELAEKQAVESEFLEYFSGLCKTLADPKIATAAKLSDIKKANIMAQLTGILGLIEDNAQGDKLNFSQETISSIFDMVKTNTVLSNLFLVGGLAFLAETVSQS